MEQGKCPGCGKVLGGKDHEFLGEYRVSEK